MSQVPLRLLSITHEMAIIRLPAMTTTFKEMSIGKITGRKSTHPAEGDWSNPSIFGWIEHSPRHR